MQGLNDRNLLVILQTTEYCLKNEISTLLGHYASHNGNSLATCRGEKLSVIEDGTDMLPRNVGNKLPL